MLVHLNVAKIDSAPSPRTMTGLNGEKSRDDFFAEQTTLGASTRPTIHLFLAAILPRGPRRRRRRLRERSRVSTATAAVAATTLLFTTQNRRK
jgi:hypothetical protein